VEESNGITFYVPARMSHFYNLKSIKQYFPDYEPEENEYGMSTGVGKHFPC
jgi:hypothetical protein